MIHRDHQNAGKSAIMASRHMNKVLMFRPIIMIPLMYSEEIFILTYLVFFQKN